METSLWDIRHVQQGSPSMTPGWGCFSPAEQSFQRELSSVPSCGPGMLNSSVADQLTRLTLKLLEKVRQLGTCASNSLLQSTALTGKIIPVMPTSKAKHFCMVLAL